MRVVIREESLVLVSNYRLVAVEYFVEQEMSISFAIGTILLAEKGPFMGLPFDIIELWLSRGNYENLASREVPTAKQLSRYVPSRHLVSWRSGTRTDGSMHVKVLWLEEFAFPSGICVKGKFGSCLCLRFVR
jgi:hypothetical protein